MENQTTTTGFIPLVTRLRYDSALCGLHGYAMPAVGVKIDTGIKDMSGIPMHEIGSRTNEPRFVFAQGHSLPISRGSPPIYDD